MSILYTLFTLWVYGMVIFWGGLLALRALGAVVGALSTKEGERSEQPVAHVYAKVEQDDKAWLRAEREEAQRELDDFMYGDGK